MAGNPTDDREAPCRTYTIRWTVRRLAGAWIGMASFALGMALLFVLARCVFDTASAPSRLDRVIDAGPHPAIIGGIVLVLVIFGLKFLIARRDGN